MRKIITALLVMQVLIISMYGFVIFENYSRSNFMQRNATRLTLYFNTLEEFDFFINLAAENNLAVSRFIFTNDRYMRVYTTDLDMGNKVTVRTGRLPSEGTQEFVSTIASSAPDQVGVITNIIPNLDISLRHMSSLRIFNGTYHVNTTDATLIRYMMSELNNNITLAYLVSLDISNFRLFFGSIPLLQLLEMVIVIPLLFLCVFIALVQYSIHKLKHSSILLLHGFSKYKIINASVLSLIKPLSLSVLIAYILLLTFILYAGHGAFALTLSLYFIIVSIMLFLFYQIIINVFILWYLHRIASIHIIKGKKPHYSIQSLNYLSKLVFVCFMLISVNFSIQNITDINERTESLSNWEMAHNSFWPRIFEIGQTWDMGIHLEISNALAGFHDDIAYHFNGFIMNPVNIRHLESGLMPRVDMSTSPPIRLLPNGFSVTVSPNFLHVNPILTVDGANAHELLVWNDYIMNILVPENLRPYHEYLSMLFLDEFFFRKITVDNIYNNEFGYAFNTTTIDQLSLNIIYVKNGQYYFTFNHDVSLRSGNMVKDPIAIVYTGNVHPSILTHHFGNGFYFFTDASDPFNEIFPLLLAHGLESAILRIDAVYDQKGLLINELRNALATMIIFSLVLLSVNLIVTYNLVANYFEKNKKKIFIKNLFGYDSLDRNNLFIIRLTIQNIFIVTILGLFFGTTTFLIGIAFVAVDMIIALMVEQFLLRKSYGKIMKGEH